MFMSECSLKDVELDLFLILWKSAQFSDENVRRLRAQAVVAPEETSGAEFLRLSQHVVWEAAAAKPCPTWMVPVCQQRFYFGATALSFTADSEQQFWKFVYASQSPREIHVSRLLQVPIFMSAVPVTGDNWKQLAIESPKYRFEVNVQINEAARDWKPLDIEETMVLAHLEHVGDRLLESDSEWMSLHDCWPQYQRRRHASVVIEAVAQGGHILIVRVC